MPVNLRLVLPLLLALGGAGCFTWRSWDPAAPLADGAHLPHRLRVTTADRRLALNAPYVRGDSVFGRTDADTRDTVGFAVAEVRGLEAERFHLWRTLGATVVAPAAAFVAAYLIVCDGGEGCKAQTAE
jgi:hypothetical protein